MLKKIILGTVILVTSLTLVGCGNSNQNSESSSTSSSGDKKIEKNSNKTSIKVEEGAPQN